MEMILKLQTLVVEEPLGFVADGCRTVSVSTITHTTQA